MSDAEEGNGDAEDENHDGYDDAEVEEENDDEEQAFFEKSIRMLSRWLPKLTLRCSDKEGKYMGGHNATSDSLYVECMCGQVHPDGCIMTLEAWAVEHALGQNADDMDEDELDSVCFERVKVATGGIAGQSLGEHCRQTAAKSGADRLPQRTALFTYWYSEVIDKAKRKNPAKKYGELAEVWGELVAPDRGIWYKAELLGTPPGPHGEREVLYLADGMKQKVLPGLCYNHWGKWPPPRGEPAQVLPVVPKEKPCKHKSLSALADEGEGSKGRDQLQPQQRKQPPQQQQQQRRQQEEQQPPHSQPQQPQQRGPSKPSARPQQAAAISKPGATATAAHAAAVGSTRTAPEVDLRAAGAAAIGAASPASLVPQAVGSAVAKPSDDFLQFDSVAIEQPQGPSQQLSEKAVREDRPVGGAEASGPQQPLVVKKRKEVEGDGAHKEKVKKRKHIDDAQQQQQQQQQQRRQALQQEQSKRAKVQDPSRASEQPQPPQREGRPSSQAGGAKPEGKVASGTRPGKVMALENPSRPPGLPGGPRERGQGGGLFSKLNSGNRPGGAALPSPTVAPSTQQQQQQATEQAKGFPGASRVNKDARPPGNKTASAFGAAPPAVTAAVGTATASAAGPTFPGVASAPSGPAGVHASLCRSLSDQPVTHTSTTMAVCTPATKAATKQLEQILTKHRYALKTVRLLFEFGSLGVNGGVSSPRGRGMPANPASTSTNGNASAPGVLPWLEPKDRECFDRLDAALVSVAGGFDVQGFCYQAPPPLAGRAALGKVCLDSSMLAASAHTHHQAASPPQHSEQQPDGARLGAQIVLLKQEAALEFESCGQGLVPQPIAELPPPSSLSSNFVVAVYRKGPWELKLFRIAPRDACNTTGQAPSTTAHAPSGRPSRTFLVASMVERSEASKWKPSDVAQKCVQVAANLLQILDTTNREAKGLLDYLY